MPTLLTGLGPFFTFLKMAIAFTSVDFSASATEGSLNGLIAGIQMAALWSVFAVGYYYRSIAFICPECHKVFRPGKAEFVFANHTPTTRKLKCRECGHRGFCVETYQPMRGEA